MKKKILLLVTAIVLSMASAFAQYNITVSANPIVAGTVSGGGYNIPFGTSVVICAYPNLCYKFTHWSEDGILVSYENCFVFSVTQSHHLVANFVFDCDCDPISSFPWTEGFENIGVSLPLCWKQEIVSGAGWNWAIVPDSVGSPATAHSGISKAQIFLNFLGLPVYTTRLITPVFDLSTLNDPILTFWHTQTGPAQLIVNYKNSPSGEWTLLKSFFIWDIGNIPDWQEDIILLPEKSDYYQIAFEGIFLGGGIADLQLDDISINGEQTCRVTVLSNPLGLEGGSNNIPCGTEITVCIAPHEGYDFVNWTEDNIEVSIDECYTFTVIGAHTLVANFVLNDIFLIANPQEGGSVLGGGSFRPGTSATVSANSNNGYTFVGWNKNGIVSSTDPTYTFIVTEDLELVANFEKSPLNVIESTETSIKIYPNPTGSELKIVSGKLKVDNIEIYDVFGKKVGVSRAIVPETTIDVSHLSAGIYFVKINTEAGEVIKKVLKDLRQSLFNSLRSTQCRETCS
ncbi:MAG: T9SS type A sorting domain-containing protein [Bacteroidales bacterium]|jgi:uncharacterized repeat protein (TIGR02543 family)|nr:T9SS type A sorting domain-containing protein [Bacteroidales bacterium]